MATRIAWLLNLDADLELREPASYRPPRLTPARVRELCSRMLDLVAPDDLVLTEHAAVPPPSAACLQLFCPTPSALARAAALGFAPAPAPALQVLRRVNSRRFCAELGHGLPGAAFVLDMPALERQLQQPSFTGSHLLKREYSFAGREQRRVHGGVLDASTLGFCARSFARGEGLQVEPCVERSADFSRHGYLMPTGELLRGATREQRCDAFGRFLGMLPGAAALHPSEDAALAHELTQTAEALRAAAYFGPFGIDAFRYRLPDGTQGWNARCEINARFSMGYPRALLLDALMALGLR